MDVERLTFMFHIFVTISLMTCAAAALDRMEIDDKLQSLNKPAVKSFKSINGDTIDCVEITKQPAFHHPLLKNHEIQMQPSYVLSLETEASNMKRRTSRNVGIEVSSQFFQKSVSCPDGTIPIRRIKSRGSHRSSSIGRFSTNLPYNHEPDTPLIGDRSPVIDLNNTKYKLGNIEHRSFSVLISVEKDYIGASGEINVWRPEVAADDFSTGQIWIVGSTTDDFESVEAGWMVNPKLYGNGDPHFFVAWTKDSYKTTGCFDLTCPGFVQTTPKHLIGTTFTPWSVVNGQQYHVSMGIIKDPKTSNWWLHFGNPDIAVGYWPHELFTQLKTSGPMVQWGGQVFSSGVRTKPHTTTQMGSGLFSEGRTNFAAFVAKIRVLDADDPTNKIYPFTATVNNSESLCYNGFLYEEGFIGDPMYFFGGPGQSPICP